MPHHHLSKPVLCAALILATTPANAQPISPAAEPEHSAVDLADANSDITLAGLTPSVAGEAASISLPTLDARFPDVSIFAEGSDRRFVLDNPMAQAIPLSGAIAPPATKDFQNSSTDVVEYTLLSDALRDSGQITGFAGMDSRTRVESDWRIPDELNVAVRSNGFYENSIVDGQSAKELSPLYYRPLTERLNLAVRSYVGYEDASPGNSDPIPYRGIALTISREARPK